MDYDSADLYFSNVTEIAAPLQGFFAKLTPDQAGDAEIKIKQAAEKYRTNGKIGLPFAVRLFSARK